LLYWLVVRSKKLFKKSGSGGRPRRFACPSASCEANRGASQKRSSGGGKSEQDRATVVANSHPGKPAGKCHRKYTADGPPPAETGNGEMVRQERTAAAATTPAGQTPPPARLNMPMLGPGDIGG